MKHDDRRYDDGDPTGPWFYAYRSPRTRMVAGCIFLLLGLGWWIVTARASSMGAWAMLVGAALLFWGLFTVGSKRHEWDD